MKVQVQSKKGLQTTLSIIVDKEEIKRKLDLRLSELQDQVDLKGFRKGKVPSSVIKNQFGKAIYGEIIDKILKESTSKAIKDKKLKVATQPRIDLKTFGEGKDLNFEITLDLLPEIKTQSLEKFKATNYSIKISNAELDDRLKNIANEYKSFEDKPSNSKSEKGDQVVFNYEATVDGKEFEGSTGKGVSIELGKDLFLKDFDKQLIGVKKNDKKKVIAVLPQNHPNKDLANKETIFNCEIMNIKIPKKSKLDDELAKKIGAKNLEDLSQKVKDQISNQYIMALNSVTKKEILDQLENSHKLEIPKNLIDNEVKSLPNTPETKDKDDEEKIKAAEKRIKLGLILNEYGEKNSITVSQEEIKNEIQKQVKSMPGQEKIVYDYYQKNPSATQHLQSSLYEEKILKFIKSKIKLINKELSIKEAEKFISDFNEKLKVKTSSKIKKKQIKSEKTKKISKK